MKKRAIAMTDQHENVYICIGRRIRERRKLLKLNQTELAELMGFSYQQIQKYETGCSRVSAGKLLLFAKILNVPPSYFYEGIQLDDMIGQHIKSGIIQKNRAQPLHILLIEDNPADVILFRKAAAAYIEKTEVHAIHGSEMVAGFLKNCATTFEQPMPDIIVLELALPRLNGIELLRAIKKNPCTCAVPVIVLTNSINTKDMTEAYECGAAGFIQKSVDLDEYIEAIGTVIKYWAKIVVLPCAA